MNLRFLVRTFIVFVAAMRLNLKAVQSVCRALGCWGLYLALLLSLPLSLLPSTLGQANELAPPGDQAPSRELVQSKELVQPKELPASTNCVSWQGSLEQGGFVWGKVSPRATVKMDGVVLDVLPDGTTMVGFTREAPEKSELSVVSGETNCTQTLNIAQREYNIQRVEGVPSKTVTPPQEQLERIRREGAQVKAARKQLFDRPALLGSVLGEFVWPVAGADIRRLRQPALLQR